MAKKRVGGEGSIRKRKDGRWEGRYTAEHDPETGKVIYKNVLGKTQAEVKEKLKRAIGETQALDITEAGKYTVGEWMEVWFQDYAKIKVRPSSHQTYQDYIHNHIRPNIGDIPLEKLTSLDLQKFYKKLLTQGRVDRLEAKGQPKGLSVKTVRNIHQILSSARRQPRTTASASLCENFPSILRCSFLQYIQYCRKPAPRLNAKFTRKFFYRTLPLAEDTVSVLREQRRKVGNSPWVFPSPNGGPISPDSVLHMLHLAVADFISLVPSTWAGLAHSVALTLPRQPTDAGLAQGFHSRIHLEHLRPAHPRRPASGGADHGECAFRDDIGLSDG